ncbi:MAG TPA: YggS family pyridoxal phosphate-dependent enzyme [Membranihabitans sp.]|nr:YggS family pyridoxal phosphate-dependent enzyme [Membranihabitans sp.]
MDQARENNYKKSVLANLAATRQRIRQVCDTVGRHSEDVRLMLVTKTIPVDVIQSAMDQGELLIGENLAEELDGKHDQLLAGHRPEIHFIGNLQKASLDTVIHNSDCIQTVDHFLLATEMNQKLLELDKKMDVLIQVNTSRRDTPYGISPAHAIGLVLQVSRLSQLRIRGLMTLGIFGTTQEIARGCFRLLRNLSDEIVLLNIPGVSMDILSMGMSDHLETAIEEGSTLVRVGTAIFGERETPDSFYWKM